MENSERVESEDGLNYFAIAQLEGIDLKLISDAKLRYKNLGTPSGKDFKIPLISHHIWLTNPNDPKEMRENDYISFKHIMNVLDSAENWKHWFWTNCKNCLPKTNKQLQSINIELRDISEIHDQLTSYHIVKDLCYKKMFGIAADFLRLDILKNFGGFYSDLNYILAHSPEPYMKKFDFLVHSDRGGVLVDVYMISAKPNHPILEEACNKIYKNFIDPPYYVSLASNSSMHIQDYTGIMTYLPFNFAFFKNVNTQTKDLVFPLETKFKYPINAKQPFLFDEYEQEINSFLPNLCENTNESKDNEEMLQHVQNYYDNEICMTDIIGFDHIDGNSWFEGGTLYQD